MTFRKLGLSVAMTAFALLAAFSTAESAQAGRGSGGHHGHHGHHGGHHGSWHHKQKTCFSWYGGRRCFYR